MPPHIHNRHRLDFGVHRLLRTVILVTAHYSEGPTFRQYILTYSVYNDLALLWRHLLIEAILGRFRVSGVSKVSKVRVRLVMG